MILGEKVLIEVFTSLGHCAGLVGSKLLTFQDNVLAPSASHTLLDCFTLEDGTYVVLAMVTNQLPSNTAQHPRRVWRLKLHYGRSLKCHEVYDLTQQFLACTHAATSAHRQATKAQASWRCTMFESSLWIHWLMFHTRGLTSQQSLHFSLLIIVQTLAVWPVEGWLEHLQSSTNVYPCLNQENHPKVWSTHGIDNRSCYNISCISIAVSPSLEFEAKQHKCFVPSAL